MMHIRGLLMRTNIVLDDDLVNEAFRLTDARTKKELIHLALEELIRVRRKRNLAELAGRIELRDDFDHKAMRDVRSDDR
jgi:Arc/MetJ family transcription regulator